ncbi:MAG: polymerase sigma factor, sigma-70 family [Candidatus Saccharibacteria bacterium]|nr:polymerase sigma factor, sigma-70 family [Candidatus Saccharibacteria bacterium]
MTTEKTSLHIEDEFMALADELEAPEFDQFETDLRVPEAAGGLAVTETVEPIPSDTSRPPTSQPIAKNGPDSLRTHKSESREGRKQRNEQNLEELYLDDIGRYALLTKDDEQKLAQIIEAGVKASGELAATTNPNEEQQQELMKKIADGQKAHRDFTNANLRWVVTIANRSVFQNRGLSKLELYQEGNLGLMHAVDKFDWRRGFKFSTYSANWIVQSITRGIAKHGRTIRLPVREQEALGHISAARIRLESKGITKPTAIELSNESYLPLDLTHKILSYPQNPISLNRSEFVESEHVIEVQDRVADVETSGEIDNRLTQLAREQVVAKLLGVLTPEERDILRTQFGLDGLGERKIPEAAKELGINKNQVDVGRKRIAAKLLNPAMGIDLAMISDLLQ